MELIRGFEVAFQLSNLFACYRVRHFLLDAFFKLDPFDCAKTSALSLRPELGPGAQPNAPPLKNFCS